MMTDKELIEYAAKAADLKIVGLINEIFCQPDNRKGGFVIRNERGGDSCWNPLEDSKDAFELMTKLKISVVMDPYEEYVCAQYSDYGANQFYEKIVYFSGDLAKDYRLAITTCAAKTALT